MEVCWRRRWQLASRVFKAKHLVKVGHSVASSIGVLFLEHCCKWAAFALASSFATHKAESVRWTTMWMVMMVVVVTFMCMMIVIMMFVVMMIEIIVIVTMIMVLVVLLLDVMLVLPFMMMKLFMVVMLVFQSFWVVAIINWFLLVFMVMALFVGSHNHCDRKQCKQTPNCSHLYQ